MRGTRVQEDKFKGLIGAVGKHIALDGKREEYQERLESLDSAEAFREFLQDAPIGMDEKARAPFIEQATREDDWRDNASRLAMAIDVQKAEFWDASA